MSDIQTRIAAMMADRKNTRLALATALAERNAQLDVARDEYRKLRDAYRALRAASEPVARPVTVPITTETFFTKADGSRWVKVRTGTVAITRPVAEGEAA